MKKVTSGIDAPVVPIVYSVAALFFFSSFFWERSATGRFWDIVVGLIFVIGTGIFLHTSLRGKKVIWERLLTQSPIDPNAQVLDLGCGHGAVLGRVAQELSGTGHAVGVDLWRSRDQSQNSQQATMTNMAALGVADRVTLVTADMVDLPYDHDRFDVVTTSFAMHNIKPQAKRDQALEEAVRVLKPGGELLIVDTEHHRRGYQNFLEAAGCRVLLSKSAGFDGWWTGPWQGSYVIRAVKGKNVTIK